MMSWPQSYLIILPTFFTHKPTQGHLNAILLLRREIAAGIICPPSLVQDLLVSPLELAIAEANKVAGEGQFLVKFFVLNAVVAQYIAQVIVQMQGQEADDA
jgi:hypothetical protein